MIAFPHLQQLARECRGAAAVEFAIVGAVALLLMFGVLDLGLLMWTRNSLQTTAALTARCVAIGSSLCANAAQFAVNTAGQWIVPGIIGTSDVTIASATSCNGASGSFTTVNISSEYWASGVLPPPFANTVLQVSACFPNPS